MTSLGLFELLSTNLFVLMIKNFPFEIVLKLRITSKSMKTFIDNKPCQYKYNVMLNTFEANSKKYYNKDRLPLPKGFCSVSFSPNDWSISTFNSSLKCKLCKKYKHYDPILIYKYYTYPQGHVQGGRQIDRLSPDWISMWNTIRAVEKFNYGDVWEQIDDVPNPGRYVMYEHYCFSCVKEADFDITSLLILGCVRNAKRFYPEKEKIYGKYWDYKCVNI